jgi:hypothetical protein
MSQKKALGAIVVSSMLVGTAIHFARAVSGEQRAANPPAHAAVPIVLDEVVVYGEVPENVARTGQPSGRAVP